MQPQTIKICSDVTCLAPRLGRCFQIARWYFWLALCWESGILMTALGGGCRCGCARWTVRLHRKDWQVRGWIDRCTIRLGNDSRSSQGSYGYRPVHHEEERGEWVGSEDNLEARGTKMKVIEEKHDNPSLCPVACSLWRCMQLAAGAMTRVDRAAALLPKRRCPSLVLRCVSACEGTLKALTRLTCGRRGC